jgi:hypothetical protein
MNYLFTAKNGQMEFTSEISKSLFQQNLRENEGQQYVIEKTKNPVSDALRAYYFGAVIPIIRTTCEEWEELSSEEIHEVIKKMLFYFETYNPLTKRMERFGRSVMKKDDWNSTRKAMEFLEIIRQYLADCGLEMPDSEEYKRWRDSAPNINEQWNKETKGQEESL